MSEARPLNMRKPAKVNPYALIIHWRSDSDIWRSARMVGSAIWTMEKSRITMNWAVTSSPRIRPSRRGVPGPSLLFGVAKTKNRYKKYIYKSARDEKYSVLHGA